MTTEEVMEELLARILLEGAYAEVLRIVEAAVSASEGTDEEKRYALTALRTQALTCTADLDGMTREGRLLLTCAPSERAHEAATLAANAFICAGRYGEALATEAWADAHADTSEPYDEGQIHLLRINLAEADYNLGDWTGAKARLSPLHEDELWGSLLTHGLRAQRAWIAAHEGDPAPLHAFLDDFDPLALSPLYRAEQHFCAAVCNAALGRHTEALSHAERGAQHAMRASSRRNAHFLLAMLKAPNAQNDHDAEVLRHYEAGAAHAYLGQGGDALLAWGDLLHKNGRADEARAAWGFAKTRDPESAAARRASEKLGTNTGP